MVLPNFIFGGASKSGSSALFEYIKQHPDVCMSKVKEPFFFDFNFEKGQAHYESFFLTITERRLLVKQLSSIRAGHQFLSECMS